MGKYDNGLFCIAQMENCVWEHNEDKYTFVGTQGD